MYLGVFTSVWVGLLFLAHLHAVSAAVVEYLASDNSSTAAWRFEPLYDYFYFDPAIYDVVGGCATVNVVGLGYGGRASISFTGSRVFLQTISTTSGLPSSIKLSQGGRVLSQDAEIRNDAGQPTCRSDVFYYTQLDPSQPALLEITASTAEQVGVPPFFMIQGIQVIVENEALSTTEPGTTSSSVSSSGSSAGTPAPTSHQTPSGSTNVPLIAGVAVGAFVGAAAVILAVLLLCRRRRRQRRSADDARRVPVQPVWSGPDPAAASLMERSPSGKVTTMSAGLSSPWAGLSSPDPTSTGRTSLYNSGASRSNAPLGGVGNSSLERSRSIAPPAYMDVARPLETPEIAAQKRG